MKATKQNILIGAVLAGVCGVSGSASAKVPFCNLGDLVYSTVINVMQGKAAETAEAFSSGFVKTHNGVDITELESHSLDYFTNGFAVAKVAFVVPPEVAYTIGSDHTGRFHFRYNEVITFGDGDVITQYEDAFITMDEGSCQITRWDQYGDNAEQAAVHTKIMSLKAAE